MHKFFQKKKKELLHSFECKYRCFESRIVTFWVGWGGRRYPLPPLQKCWVGSCPSCTLCSSTYAPFIFKHTFHLQTHLSSSNTPFIFKHTFHLQTHLSSSNTPFIFKHTFHFQTHLSAQKVLI